MQRLKAFVPGKWHCDSVLRLTKLHPNREIHIISKVLKIQEGVYFKSRLSVQSIHGIDIVNRAQQ